MRDDFDHRAGEPAERGRLEPHDEPGAALPMRAFDQALPAEHTDFPVGTLTCQQAGIEPPESVIPDMLIADVAARLARMQPGYLPVEENGRLIGAVTLEDLMGALAAGQSAKTPVVTIMSDAMPTVLPETLLADAVHLMMARFLRRVPLVTREGRFIGFVTLSAAAGTAARDVAVREALAQLAFSPSLWARRFL
jgi:signal-transduction protein with cAMP-binding, CBS, and nucleotidyltransferase domain